MSLQVSKVSQSIRHSTTLQIFAYKVKKGTRGAPFLFSMGIFPDLYQLFPSGDLEVCFRKIRRGGYYPPADNGASINVKSDCICSRFFNTNIIFNSS